MKKTTKILATTLISCSLFTANANEAKSEKHAKKVVELRQSVFKLLKSNIGPLGGMAKGKIEFDAKKVKKHAVRINQLSHMIHDYTKTDTSKFKLETEALDKIWLEPDNFKQRIKDLKNASKQLIAMSKTGSEMEIKKAIGGVGKTCGGCHDNFKKD